MVFGLGSPVQKDLKEGYSVLLLDSGRLASSTIVQLKVADISCKFGNFSRQRDR